MLSNPAVPLMTRPRRPRRADRADASRIAPGSDVGAGGARDGGVDDDVLRYATDYHAPVLLKETLELLITKTDGVYVDGTLGGGGHSAALLDALGPDAVVVGIDQDPDALARATDRLQDAVADGRFVAVEGNFGDLTGLLRRADLERPVDGILLDLGVSSHQIDAAPRGFSFSADGPARHADGRRRRDCGSPR